MLHQPAAFFDSIRATVLAPSLSADEVAGCNAILAAMEGEPIAYTAYALATAYHETAHSMQPIKEFGGTAYFMRRYDLTGNPLMARRLGNTQPGDGARYCGRGYVQLTGRANYAKAGLKLDLPLEDHPELAMSPDAAAHIMRAGMSEGWFTISTFADELPAQGPADISHFTDARRIINGVDKAVIIAGYAVAFQNALQAGAWLVSEDV